MNARVFAIAMLMMAVVFQAQITAQAQTGDPETLPDGMTIWIGEIVVNANVDSFFVKAGPDVHYIASGDTVRFTSRITSIRVSARNFRDAVVEFEPFTNDVRSMQAFLVPATDTRHMRNNLFYVMHYNANLSVAANPDTRLYVNGAHVGTGKAMIKLPPGIYRVRSDEPGAGSLTRRVEVTDARLLHLNMHIQPTRREITLLSLIPGGAQYRKREIPKSAALAAGVTGGVVASVVLHSRWQSRRDDFNRLRDEYWLANNEFDVARLGEEVQRAEKRVNSTGRQLTWAIGTSAVLYAWNVIDGLQPPRMGFRPDDLFNPYIVLDASSPAPHIGMRVNF